MLEIKSLTVRYGSHQPVLKDLSLSFPKKGIVALLGPSGCGKSSLLNALAGFLPAHSGTIWSDDKLLTGDLIQVPPHKRSMAMAFQRASLWPHMTVRQALTFVAQGKRTEDVKKRIKQALNNFQLEDLANLYPSQLSGGEAQTLNIARAMISEPKIMLLDEPFTGMDPLLRKQLKEHVKTYTLDNHILTLLATHYAREVKDLADRIILIREGCIHFDGPGEHFFQSSDPYIIEYLNT